MVPTIKKQLTPTKFKAKDIHQSAGILDDYAVRKNIATREGTITKVPVDANDITNKAYVDSVSGGAPEGTAVLSTGEAGGTKFLREDGDGTSSWQPAAAVHTESSTDSLTNKTIDDFSNQVEADEIHIRIRNESGSTMTRGQLVYISGYNSGLDRPLVTLADASSASTMPMLAMINDADIANNADGHATVSGRVFNIDTSAFSIGDSVYVSTTPGALSTRPSGTTDQVQRIGIILRSHASNGVIQLIGAGRTNDIPNDIDHATDLQNVGTNTHAQIDTSITATGVNSTHVAGDGSDHADVATNTSKVSYTKTNVKATINHGGTSGTSRPSGFDSVEWIGTVEPTNAANDDTWIDTT